MIRFLGAVYALACCSFSVLTPVISATENRTSPMRFELRREGPADACGGSCRAWVSAAGVITSETARDFTVFASGRELHDVPIVLDSDGGSVHGAMALGRAIRQLDLATTVGKTRELPVTSGEGRASLSTAADCESMCVVGLLGGARRQVPDDARVFVHQIWLGDRRDDPTAAIYSAQDLVLVQRDIGRLAQYVVEMGGTGELLDISLRIPPWEPMRRLSRDELARVRLATVDNAFERQADTLAAATLTTATPAQTTGPRRSQPAQQAWSLADRAGTSVLARRHPLTVEGDEIGVFDLAIGCADEVENYTISYTERRRVRNASTPLQTVTLQIGQKLLQLSVVSSGLRTDPVALETVATGLVSAGMLGTLAGANSRSLTVATSGGDDKTSIRLGNTGISQSFPDFSVRCQKFVAERIDPPRDKTGAYAHAQ